MRRIRSRIAPASVGARSAVSLNYRRLPDCVKGRGVASEPSPMLTRAAAHRPCSSRLCARVEGQSTPVSRPGRTARPRARALPHPPAGDGRGTRESRRRRHHRTGGVKQPSYRGISLPGCGAPQTSSAPAGARRSAQNTAATTGVEHARFSPACCTPSARSAGAHRRAHEWRLQPCIQPCTKRPANHTLSGPTDRAGNLWR